jgi:hypothetical protein
MISLWLMAVKVVVWAAISLIAAGFVLSFHGYIGGFSAWILTICVVYGWGALVLDVWDWSEE